MRDGRSAHRGALFGIVIVALLSAAGSARSNQGDIMGIGAAAMGRGGGGVALADDVFALYYNPAGMAQLERGAFAFGAHGGHMRFQGFPPIAWDANADGVINTDNPYDRWEVQEYDYDDPSGYHAGLVKSYTKWLRLGVCLTLPWKRLITVQQEDPYLPYYIRWKNRPQRFSIYAGLSLEPVDGLSIGLSLAILARCKLVLDFQIDAAINDEELQSGMDDDLALDLVVNPQYIELDVRPAFAPIVGLHLDMKLIHRSLAGWTWGVVYRHPLDLLIEPTILGLNLYGRAEDIGSLDTIIVPLQARVFFSILDYSTPRQIALGTALRRERFAAYVDLTWNQWSKAFPSVSRIDEGGTEIKIGLVDLDPRVVNAREPDPLLWRDTWVVRVGGEITPKPAPLSNKLKEIGVVVRFGYAYDPTWVPEQTWVTNFMDSDHHVFALGGGVRVGDPFEVIEGPIGLDAFLQIQRMVKRVHTKDAGLIDEYGSTPPGYPLPGRLTSDGIVVAAGGTLTFTY